MDMWDPKFPVSVEIFARISSLTSSTLLRRPMNVSMLSGKESSETLVKKKEKTGKINDSSSWAERKICPLKIKRAAPGITVTEPTPVQGLSLERTTLGYPGQTPSEHSITQTANLERQRDQ
jgi:hypothetical protein